MSSADASVGKRWRSQRFPPGAAHELLPAAWESLLPWGEEVWAAMWVSTDTSTGHRIGLAAFQLALKCCPEEVQAVISVYLAEKRYLVTPVLPVHFQRKRAPSAEVWGGGDDPVGSVQLGRRPGVAAFSSGLDPPSPPVQHAHVGFM